MDTSKFQADDFNPKAWINEILSSEMSSPSSSGVSPPIPLGSSPSVLSSSHDMSSQVNQIINKLQVLFSDLGSYMEQEVKNSIQKVPNAFFEIEKMQDQTINLFLSVTSLYQRIEKINHECYEGNKHFETLKQLIQLKTALSSILLTLEQSKSLTKSMQQLDLLFRDKGHIHLSTPSVTTSAVSFKDKPMSPSTMPLSPNTSNAPNFSSFTNDVEISIETLREMTNQICCVEEGVRTLEPYSEKVKNKSKPKLLQYKEKLIKTLIGGKFVNLMMEAPDSRNIESCRELIDLSQRIDNVNGIFTLMDLYYERSFKDIIEQQVKQQQFFNQILYIVKQEDVFYKKLFQGMSEDIKTQVKIRLIEFCFKNKNCSLTQQDDLQQMVMIQYKSTKQFSKQLEELALQPAIQKLLFEGFSNLQSTYLKKLEKEYLLKQVRPHLSMSDNFVECIDEALNVLFIECENALERCVTFTYGIESQTFIRVINQIFEEFGTSVNKTITSEINKIVRSKKQSSDQVVLSSQDRENVQNSLKLYQLVNDKDHGVKKKLEELELKIKNNLLEALRDVISKSADDYYVKIQTDQTFKQLNHFYNSLQEVQYPMFSVASKSMEIHVLQPSYELVKNALLSYVVSAMSKINKTNYYTSLKAPENASVEYVDDIHLPELHHSIQPSKFMSQIGEYLIKLPEQLEVLTNDDHVTFWIETICKETIALISNAVKPPKNGEKFQIQQWNSDVRYIKHILVEVLDYSSEETEFFTLLK